MPKPNVERVSMHLWAHYIYFSLQFQFCLEFGPGGRERAAEREREGKSKWTSETRARNMEKADIWQNSKSQNRTKYSRKAKCSCFSTSIFHHTVFIDCRIGCTLCVLPKMDRFGNSFRAYSVSYVKSECAYSEKTHVHTLQIVLLNSRRKKWIDKSCQVAYDNTHGFRSATTMRVRSTKNLLIWHTHISRNAIRLSTYSKSETWW